MMRRTNRIFLLLVLILSIPHEPATAQQSVSNCSQVIYAEPPTGSETYVVDRVEGQAVFTPSGEPHKRGGMSRVGVLLFSLGDSTPVVTVETGMGGTFSFPSVAPAEYVLIASRDRLQAIVVPIHVSDTQWVQIRAEASSRQVSRVSQTNVLSAEMTGRGRTTGGYTYRLARFLTSVGSGHRS